MFYEFRRSIRSWLLLRRLSRGRTVSFKGHKLHQIKAAELKEGDYFYKLDRFYLPLTCDSVGYRVVRYPTDTGQDVPLWSQDDYFAVVGLPKGNQPVAIEVPRQHGQRKMVLHI